MSTKKDDLFIVSRDGTNYKATGTQLFDFEGGATYGELTQVGGNPDGGAADGIQLYPTGTIKAAAVGVLGKALQIYQSDGTSNPTIEFTSGGNATFDKQVEATEGYKLSQLPALEDV